MLLTFNAATRRLNVSVDLFDDSRYERKEDFNGILSSDSPRVTISPDNALATIVDDDCMQVIEFYTYFCMKWPHYLHSYLVPHHHLHTDITIGFIGVPYQSLEDMGPMTFTVGVIGDTVPATDVVVSFSTVDGSVSGR